MYLMKLGKHSAAIRDPGTHDIMKENYQVLEALVRGGHRYDQIHCSFCRWRPFGDAVSAVNFGSR
jgi:hypothetical protein